VVLPSLIAMKDCTWLGRTGGLLPALITQLLSDDFQV
jgi:hypothetical protein